MVGQKLSWVGLSVGDYVIKELLGEGSYSWVFRAVHADGFSSRAIKVAKPPEAVAEGGPTSCIPTDAVWQTVGTVVKFSPETEQLLCQQAKKLQAISDPALISVEEISVRPGSCYYRMPVLFGQTLRRYMAGGPVPIDILLDIALCMDRLSGNEAFAYHGDLKPENIMVTPAGIVLIDPGYFGTIETYKGSAKQSLSDCAVTSTLYYPLLKPDDLFAVGLMMWEIACREHPLTHRASSVAADRKQVGHELWAFIREQEANGKNFVSPILKVKPPSIIRPGMPGIVEELVLNGLRLKVDPDGKLNLSKGFANFAELAGALAQLTAQNIRYL